MRSRVSLVIGSWFAVALVARGADVYVVRFDTPAGGFRSGSDCTSLSWQDQLIFHNTNPDVQSITLLGVSNGPPPADPQTLTVPASATRLSDQPDAGATATWAPDPQPPLWVAHIALPDGVLITSRARTRTVEYVCDHPIYGAITQIYAGLPLPIARTLTPPSIAQIHMATDLGGQIGGSYRNSHSRINVGVYNGGASTTSANIEVRRACDDAVLLQSSVSVPPNTIVQKAGLEVIGENCGPGAGDTYVVVTADQPSFSYVITLSNLSPPLFPASSSP